jgi:glucose/arabinose dehydrogenase
MIFLTTYRLRIDFISKPLLYMGFLFFAALFYSCNKYESNYYDLPRMDDHELEKYLENLKLPVGFKIDIYAEGIKNPRALEYDSLNKVLYVSTYLENKIYAVFDDDFDYKADRMNVILGGVDRIDPRITRYLPGRVKEKIFPGTLWPTGIKLIQGNLYIAEPYVLKRVNNIFDNIGGSPDVEVVYDNFLMRSYHGWKYLNLGPDGKLYYNNGSTCNSCIEEDSTAATIMRINLDGSSPEVYAKGVRNSMGFDWHPITKKMWFADNGVDHLGQDSPPCEINEVSVRGEHFGWPHIHGDDIADVSFTGQLNFTKPKINTEPHAAPLGIHFYTGNMFPPEYLNQLFVCEHGSKYRRFKTGYRVMLAKIDSSGNVNSYTPFIEGWLKEDLLTVTDRPVDFEQLPDGSILISSDYSDRIFRVSYDGNHIGK